MALLIGVTAFHEHLSANGPRAGVLALAALARARGTWLASRAQHGAAQQPHVHDGQDDDERDGRGGPTVRIAVQRRRRAVS